jgi:hypothetical protein
MSTAHQYGDGRVSGVKSGRGFYDYKHGVKDAVISSNFVKPEFILKGKIISLRNIKLTFSLVHQNS